MEAPICIPLPLPHIGSVNTWLLRGEPTTLVDTGPREDQALSALETGLARSGVRLEDIELILVTHHHLDHTGLATTIADRSGAQIAAFDRAAAYGRNYAERTAADRRFSLALMRHHGVPERVIADNEGFWDFIERASDAYDADVELPDGATVRAGGRDLRVVARPGHSTTDALLVDERERFAFVGDHLLGGISSNTEIYPALEPDGTRPRARVEYLQSLRETAAMPLARLLTGHGDEVTAHADLVRRRLGEHDRRCDRIVEALRSGRVERLRDRHAAVVATDGLRAAAARRLGGARAPRPPAGRRACGGARDRRRQYLRRRVLRARRHDHHDPYPLGGGRTARAS